MTIFEIQFERKDKYTRYETQNEAAHDDDLTTAIKSLRKRIKTRVWVKNARILAKTN